MNLVLKVKERHEYGSLRDIDCLLVELEHDVHPPFYPLQYIGGATLCIRGNRDTGRA